MKNEFPLVTIMIATYNSERILEKPLAAIRNQDYPQDRIEILIIDGGSEDGTRDIAYRYGCQVLDNPHTDPVNAKIIGMINAKGKYLLTIDHDEVLVNKSSIHKRVESLELYDDCKVAFCSGYSCPRGYSGLNEYISEFGDPFSLFYYRFSKGYKYYYSALLRKANLTYEDAGIGLFEFSHNENVIIELICLGTIINLEYFRSIIDDQDYSNSITHLFYRMLEHGETKTIISKNDPLEHYSVDSLKRYLPKLRWRVINNVHYSDRATQGFTGRAKEMKQNSIKKYLFPIYSFSTIFPICDAVYYAISRKNAAFLIHPYLCWYVTIYVLFQYLLRLLGSRPALTNYDGSAKRETH